MVLSQGGRRGQAYGRDAEEKRCDDVSLDS